MVDRKDPVPVARQCVLLELPRSTFYHVPIPVSAIGSLPQWRYRSYGVSVQISRSNIMRASAGTNAGWFPPRCRPTCFAHFIE